METIKLDAIPNKEKSKLPAVEVANHVDWVNAGFSSLPFNLQTGKPCAFGLFLTPSEEIRKWKDTSPAGAYLFGISTGEEVSQKIDTREIQVRPGHYRSGMIGQVLFQDNEGRIYCDVDLKGIGEIGFSWNKENRINEDPNRPMVIPAGARDFHDLKGDHVFGFRNKAHALHDVQVAEKMLDLGVRTHRIIALVSLQEIISYGGEAPFFKRKNPKKTSIAEAKKKGLIPKDLEPVVEVRAFGTKTRVQEWGLNEANRPFFRKDILREIDDARQLIIKEFKLEESDFDLGEYLKWLAEKMGRNLGIMHANGWRHGNAHGLNMTLDGRIIDFDGASKAEEEWNADGSIQERWTKKNYVKGCFEYDIETATYDLQRLFSEVSRAIFEKEFGNSDKISNWEIDRKVFIRDRETDYRMSQGSISTYFKRGYDSVRTGS
ncbi:MAG: hypothetical protein PHP25_03280 [Candidatus Moranbacteria bacterium]|nr:hypothetical protein [Candidatus Moranbacteria bacterium]